MTISNLIEVLERCRDEHGDVFVEVSGGREVSGVAAVFETGVKEPKVVAVKVQ